MHTHTFSKTTYKLYMNIQYMCTMRMLRLSFAITIEENQPKNDVHKMYRLPCTHACCMYYIVCVRKLSEPERNKNTFELKVQFARCHIASLGNIVHAAELRFFFFNR